MDPITSRDKKSARRPNRIDLGGSPDTTPAPEDVSYVPDAKSIDTENLEVLSRVTDGKELAAALRAAGYHPVIVFGNANSGKTLLLLSLLALIKTESRLKIGLRLGEPLLDITVPAGQAAWAHAEEIFGRHTQLFIDGTLPPATAVREPFFVPLVLSPSESVETKIALFESNGEWYAPDFDAGRLFPPLRKQIEQFILHFEGAISFLHVVPRTQSDGSGGGIAEDVKSISIADLAIVGALHQYAKLRSDKSQDMHLLLVSKWDAHADTHPGVSVEDVLQDSDDDVLEFVTKYCPQSYAALTGLRLRPEQVRLSAYCSARVVNKQIATLPRKAALSLQSIHEHLWNWVYRHASGGAALFEVPASSVIDRIINWVIGK